MTTQMKARATGFQATVPAGEYFLGDPCYTIKDHDRWMQLLESCNYFSVEDGKGSPIGELDGHQVLAFGTAYGDGCYTDQYGAEYGVDAGLIGLVPVALIDAKRKDLERDGQFVTFKTSVTCSTDGETLRFGKYVIKTGDDADEE